MRIITPVELPPDLVWSTAQEVGSVSCWGAIAAYAISIADASAAENAGHLLFEVTLSRSFRRTR